MHHHSSWFPPFQSHSRCFKPPDSFSLFRRSLVTIGDEWALHSNVSFRWSFADFSSRLIVSWQQIVNAKFSVYTVMEHIFPSLQSTLSRVSDFLWALGFVVSASVAGERCAWCSRWSESLKLARGEHRCQKTTTALKKRNGKCHPPLSEWIHEFSLWTFARAARITASAESTLNSLQVSKGYNKTGRVIYFKMHRLGRGGRRRRAEGGFLS